MLYIVNHLLTARFRTTSADNVPLAIFLLLLQPNVPSYIWLRKSWSLCTNGKWLPILL